MFLRLWEKHRLRVLRLLHPASRGLVSFSISGERASLFHIVPHWIPLKAKVYENIYFGFMSPPMMWELRNEQQHTLRHVF